MFFKIIKRTVGLADRLESGRELVRKCPAEGRLVLGTGAGNS